MKKTKLRFQDLPKDYAALCRILAPRPIHAAVDYAKVLEVTEAMTGFHEEFSGDQADYYELLSLLIDNYSAKPHQRSRLTAVETLKQLMKERNMGPTDLSSLLGCSRPLGASILRGERDLRLKHVRILVRRFGLSADNFLR